MFIVRQFQLISFKKISSYLYCSCEKKNTRNRTTFPFNLIVINEANPYHFTLLELLTTDNNHIA
jgi:hypothetical protein